MISGGLDLDASAVLAAARRSRAAANAAEAELLVAAVEWAHLHTVTDLDDAATWWSGSRTRGQDTGIPIAGQGCPLVSEFAVANSATAVGMSQETGRHYLGQALELAHRLPKLWARVMDGSLASWRARRVAEHTLHLSAKAAGFVDRMVAPFAHKTGPAQTQRVVDEAIARFMPELAREQAERSAEQRYFTIDHQQVSFTGTSRVHGELDLADALDLEDAIRAGAEQLKALGNDDPLDVRRAAALGVLARGQQAIEFEPGTPRPAREVVIYAHVPGEVFTTDNPDAPVWVYNAGGRLLTAAQVAAWFRAPETTKVTVKKVVDLNQHLSCTSYTPSADLAEQVRLRDRTCVFPWCTKPARGCDLDHITPHAQSGETSSLNLACLCRLHHRMKTHGDWDYSMVRPGVFCWRSPSGHLWQRDPSGTTDLTPPTVEKPGEQSGHPPDQ
jgi:hypothetical protein